MTALVPLIFVVILLLALFWCLFTDMPAVVSLALVGVILLFGHTAYQNIDDLVALWTDIQNFPDAAAAWAVATLNEITHGFTALGWVGFSLVVLFALLVGSALSWPSVKALVAAKVAQLERERDAAKEEAKREREKAKQAEQAAAQDREDARRAVSLMRSAESRAQGLQGQLDNAVMMADKRGKENKDLRHDNKRLQSQVDELQAKLSAGQQKAIVSPLVRERRGSTKRETRTGP